MLMDKQQKQHQVYRQGRFIVQKQTHKVKVAIVRSRRVHIILTNCAVSSFSSKSSVSLSCIISRTLKYNMYASINLRPLMIRNYYDPIKVTRSLGQGHKVINVDVI